MEMQTPFSRIPCPEKCKYCSRTEKKFGVIDPIVHQITTPSTSALDPWSDESVRKDQLADPEIKPIIEFKESSDENPAGKTSSLSILQRSSVTELFGTLSI
ncbi:gag-pol [Trichonephila clavipes]|nr:gag-pol [Trichonephila clavipes]